MTKIRSLFGPVIVAAYLCMVCSAAWADTLRQKPTTKRSMVDAYTAFKELQEYLVDYETFEQQSNEEKISKLISALRDSFHTVSTAPAEVDRQPGFSSTLRVLTNMLADVGKSFRDGNKRWALWRMKTVANHCITCHTSYQVKVRFIDPNADIATLSAFEQGEFFLASRQFDKAAKAFYQAARNPTQFHSRIHSLRKWLIIYTRVAKSPLEALQKLSELVKSEKLIPYERDTIEPWIAALKRWRDEGKPTKDPLKEAERLLKHALTRRDILSSRIHEVEALRATALLHSFLEGGSMKNDQRRKGLYLLGLAYSKLPLYFINELPEFYLEQCIRENPDTAEAREAYRLFKELVTVGYTGSSGTHLPAEVLLKFQELHNLAYGIPEFKGRI